MTAASLWSWDYFFSILPDIFGALRITLQLTLFATIVAYSLGLLLALGRRSTTRLISWPIAGLIEFIRSTPLLVQLYFLYFVLPNFGILWDGFLVSVMALGLHNSTYASECYRAGIEAVSKGQWEAARALNISPTRTLIGIVIPQAIRVALPSLVNTTIGMFKDTAIVSLVGVIEIMAQAQMDAADTFRSVEPYLLVGFIYLVLSYLSSNGARRLEHRLALAGG
jgi:polar amino acid transport system permease protein